MHTWLPRGVPRADAARAAPPHGGQSCPPSDRFPVTATVKDPTTVRALGWGVAVGLAQVAVAASLWWLELSTVHALMITLIAAIYIGFAVSDGRTQVIIVECTVAAAFFVTATATPAASPWLIVALYVAHGVKDAWQHRTRFLRGTRWWPPFCFAVDLTVAGIVTVQILSGVAFRS